MLYKEYQRIDLSKYSTGLYLIEYRSNFDLNSLNTKFFLLSKMNHFFHDVIDVVKLIPKGKVTTYGKIASFLGSVKSSRSVGWALNKLSDFDKVPAHRVVNRKWSFNRKISFLWMNFTCKIN